MDLYELAVAKALSGSGGGEPVIEALSVTENGTYTAPSGVDGYSPVNVSVPTTGSNFVVGSFTTQDTTGVQTINVPYTGNGFPIVCVVWPENGSWNRNDTDWYSRVQRYSIGVVALIKNNTMAPTYIGGGYNNKATVFSLKKTSDSSATNVTSAYFVDNGAFTRTDPSNADGWDCVHFYSNNIIKVWTSTGLGLVCGITYRYLVLYSE